VITPKDDDVIDSYILRYSLDTCLDKQLTNDSLSLVHTVGVPAVIDNTA
jgi:hypothetical protein